MLKRMANIGWAVAALLLGCTGARAGYYCTMDAEEETRWSQNYEREFRDVLLKLRTIAVPNPKSDPPMRRRYVLVELLGSKGLLDLHTLEQKMNYSAVLIRRGKADEACQLLLPLTREHPQNFVIASQCATACFLASLPEFKADAPSYMKQALEAWPERWAELEQEQKQFLESIGWDETRFVRNRRYEVYFERLLRNRYREDKLRAQKNLVTDTLDPIFVDAEKKPVRFVNDAGEFRVGQIPETEWKKLPRDAIEAVEQLVVWLPHDDRLFWLLGEVFNASAMAPQRKDEQNMPIQSAYKIFEQMRQESFQRQIFARKEIETRYEALSKDPRSQPDPPRGIDPGGLLPAEDGDDKGLLANQQGWRALAVGFVTGFAVALFALWQFQEMRRRRQARLTAGH